MKAALMAALMVTPVLAQPPDIVFIGDSITLGWADKQPDFFSDQRVDRGIGGQTSTRILARFDHDVVAVHPRAVHIMAGTNDVAGNDGPMSAAATEDNLAAMARAACRAGIAVILAAIPPAADFPWRPGLRPAGKIIAINRWIARFTRRHHLIFADYWSVLQDGRGGLRREFGTDGVHPSAQGYYAMRPVAEAALAQLQKNGAEGRSAPRGGDCFAKVR